MSLKGLLPWLAVALALALLLAFGGSGSKPTGGRGGPVRDCVEVGTQCRMGGSKLGVCATSPSGGFTCMSQH